MDTPNVNGMCFTFGSNLAGKHWAGAAKYAYERKGAEWQEGIGHYGNSYAIPTKDKYLHSLPIKMVKAYVDNFISYANHHPELNFQVTAIGCGLAGFRNNQIAPLFSNAPRNCYFDLNWEPYLGDKNYWGSF